VVVVGYGVHFENACFYTAAVCLQPMAVPQQLFLGDIDKW